MTTTSSPLVPILEHVKDLLERIGKGRKEIEERPVSEAETESEQQDEQLTPEMREAFAEAYDRYADPLQKYIASKLPGPKEDAHDIFCQVWIVAISKLDPSEWNPDKRTSDDPLQAWLFQCARIRIVKYLDLKNKYPQVSIDLLQDILLVDVDEKRDIPSSNQRLIEQLRDAIRELKEVHQKLLDLRYQHGGMSFREIGEALGKSEGAARAMHFYIIGQLRQKLEGAAIL